jgi:hypothetical protein
MEELITQKNYLRYDFLQACWNLILQYLDSNSLINLKMTTKILYKLYKDYKIKTITFDPHIKTISQRGYKDNPPIYCYPSYVRYDKDGKIIEIPINSKIRKIIIYNPLAIREEEWLITNNKYKLISSTPL